MRLITPYGIRFQEDGRIDVFPAIEVDVLGREGKGIHTVFHIDSGATTSALPLSDAIALETRIDYDKKIVVRGISDEELIGYRDSVIIRFGKAQFTIPLIFIEHPAVPRVLGREGVFTNFGILFDEARRRTGFFDSKKERKLLDTFFES